MANWTYNKWELSHYRDTVMMEYKHFYKLVARYLPPSHLQTNINFKAWLVKNSETIIYKLADYIEIGLPEPRIEYYKSNDYFVVQKNVLGYTN